MQQLSAHLHQTEGMLWTDEGGEGFFKGGHVGVGKGRQGGARKCLEE